MSIENPFDEMRKAVQAAQDLQRAIEQQANSLAVLLDGNLRHVASWRLAKIKAQLRDFNAHTGRWKDEKP